MRTGIKAAPSNFHSIFETLKKLKAKKGYRENKVEVGRIGKMEHENNIIKPEDKKKKKREKRTDIIYSGILFHKYCIK